MKIILDDFDELKTFMKGCEFFDGDIIVRQNRYVVSGKSFLGMTSLELSNPIDVSITETNKRVAENFYSYLKKWSVE